MSQIIRIRKTQMIEREYLLRALEDLGLAWEENAQMGPVGNRRRVEIKVRGRNVGFHKSGDSFRMFSFQMPSSSRFLQKVTQRYVYHVTRAKLEAQGFAVASEEVEQGGKIHLVLRRMA